MGNQVKVSMLRSDFVNEEGYSMDQQILDRHPGHTIVPGSGQFEITRAGERYVVKLTKQNGNGK